MKKMSIYKKYSYFWITLGLFLFSIAGHWIFSWFAYVDEQRSKKQPVVVSSYLVQTSRDTLENWQSEFLQLMWQVGGLALFLYVGSTQSKEGDERKEAKLDAILRAVNPKEAEKILENLNEKYSKQ
ncbi:DUF6766 family protein [Legionella sp. CNM-1927-20]|uniref:DUF6766 family protein n=1 Tax=Legionella sp. CNM-1927-20 TaxID=3422221 RepID=UPI00403AB1ED